MNYIETVLAYRNNHKNLWKGRSDIYWFWRLFQEVMELLGVIIGTHNDSKEHELCQISSICLNWLDKEAK